MIQEKWTLITFSVVFVFIHKATPVVSIAGCQHLDNENIQVYTEAGIVAGRRWKFGDLYMNEYLGIPYALPPVGERRFKKPEKLERLIAEPFIAHEYGRPCIQFMDYHTLDRYAGDNMKRQSENCLFLNVFSPYNSTFETKKHPVLVWIHGGSFLAGSGDTGIDPEVVASNLINRGVVLVTLNYRLGPLGFMATSTGQDGIYDGNYGLYDILMVLQYINRNINHFGGDQRKVTIMGESAGGAAVSILAASPLAKDLVHGVIVLSGSSQASWAVHSYDEPKWHVNNILRYLKCDKSFDAEDVKEIRKSYPNEQPISCNLQMTKVNCADGLNTESNNDMDEKRKCLQQALKFESIIFKSGMTAELGVSRPVVDGQLIPKFGATALSQYARVPMMTGVAQLEWAHKKPIYYGFKSTKICDSKLMHSKIAEILSQSFQSPTRRKLDNSTMELIGNATYNRYITSQDTAESWSMEKFVRALQQIESDVEFVSPCWLEADAYARSNLPVYLYSWDYLPKSRIIEHDKRQINFFGKHLNVTTRRSTQFTDAFHGLDHGFLFTRGYSGNFELIHYDHNDRDMSALFCTLVTNFVKSSNPTHEPIRGFEWPKYSTSNRQYVSLQIPPSIVNSDFYYPTPQFWNDHIVYLTSFIRPDLVDENKDISPEELTENERQQLAAYRRAWVALWLLVGGIAVTLWIFIACLVFKRCTSTTPNKAFDNIVLNSR